MSNFSIFCCSNVTKGTGVLEHDCAVTSITHPNDRATITYRKKVNLHPYFT